MLLAVLLVGIVSGVAVADGEQNVPTLELSQSETSVGEAIVVRGAGWNPNGVLQVETCGNLALNGSTDCAVASGVSVRVAADGSFSAGMVIATPPSPCPCVVSVRSSDGGVTADADVAIAGTVRATPSRNPSAQDTVRSDRTPAEVGSTQGFAEGMQASLLPWGLVGAFCLAAATGVLLRRHRRIGTSTAGTANDDDAARTWVRADVPPIELTAHRTRTTTAENLSRAASVEDPPTPPIPTLPPPVLAAGLRERA